VDAVCVVELKIYMQQKQINLFQRGVLLALGSFGETVFIKMNNSEKPYMFSANDARPKTVYENLKDELGLDYKIIGGRTVKYAKKSIKKEIDGGYPVVLGPLDMFYLPYLKMYHVEHIPIHYVLMTGYDEEKNCVLIYDCDREDMIELAVSDLELAWNIEKNGVGDKNGFIKIRLGENLPDKYTLSCNCLLKKAERQFRKKPYILGISAYEKIARELPKWKGLLKGIFYMADFSIDVLRHRKKLMSVSEFQKRNRRGIYQVPVYAFTFFPCADKSKKNKRITGYFQNEKYFKDIKEILRE